MNLRRRLPWLAFFLGLFAFVALPTLAVAGPRSGGSFGGRMGFRSSGGGMSSSGRSYSGGGYGSGYGGGGSHFSSCPAGATGATAAASASAR